ncbi:transposase, partial [Lactobacillus helveticus]|nr:transposase [Lactobacillus helveticus]
MAFKTKLAEHEIQLGTRQYRIYPEGEQTAWSWLPLMRKEHEWLKRVNSTCLQFTVERFSDAMWAFLTKKQVRQGKPRFKSRK